jgi:DnaJ homolog subfamily A member 5
VFDEEEEEEMRAKRKEELYCVACNKKFKSDKQWKNHEQSKKHRDKIAELRIVFKEEEEALKEADGDGDEVDVGFDFKPTQESDENESESLDAAEELSEELEGLEVNDKEDSDKDLDRAEQRSVHMMIQVCWRRCCQAARTRRVAMWFLQQKHPWVV